MGSFEHPFIVAFNKTNVQAIASLAVFGMYHVDATRSRILFTYNILYVVGAVGKF